MTIYQIECDVDNYCSLLPADSEVAASSLLAFDGTSRAAEWDGSLQGIIDNSDEPEPDILDLGSGNLVLHKRSLALLRGELSNYCELLPIHWNDSNGSVINVLGLSLCLDAERTKWILGSESGKRIRIEKYEFSQDLVPSSLIFKIRERPFELFCTDRFKCLIESQHLTGLDFVAVWSESTG